MKYAKTRVQRVAISNFRIYLIECFLICEELKEGLVGGLRPIERKGMAGIIQAVGFLTISHMGRSTIGRVIILSSLNPKCSYIFTFSSVSVSR